ncbi:restriction endonuclease subunit S [Nitrosomonas sp.]|uniref:restriction endonuclease subunit S n=1 Tax=Nitrosomonas sp. TaxID=42353 RepID=UPI0025F0E2CC|nr:restriction endonuclease subunit S [Nitrosomonas sp.]
MSAETPGIDSDKNRDTKTSTSKTPPATPTITIPPFEKGGPGGIIPKELGWIHHLDIWTAAETEKKSGRGRSSGNGVSVYGIQKLRELILELAVRGKLVPQDPNDEPAGELIKRMQIEKAKLIAEGKIKKDKPLPPISDEEKSFELPQGWECARLTDLVNILNGRAYKKEELLDTGTPVLRVGNLFTSEHWYYSDLTLEDEKYCNKGDLLFAWSASFGPFIWEGPKVIFHYHIWRLDLYGCDFIYKNYLYTFLLEQAQKIKASGHGVMMVHMTKEKMKKLIIFLPPLEEQHRIVTKVDELMALCNQLESQHIYAAEAHEKLVSHLLGTLTQSQNAHDFSANWQRIAAHFDTLFTTEASIDALKQTLLQLAVMGKLVPQDPTDEPASELLKRIQAEKARLVAEGKIKKGKSPLTPLLPRGGTGSAAATSINPTTITLSTPPLSNSTPNPNSTPPFEKWGSGGIQRGISEEEKPFGLPQGWMWVALDEISLVGTGATPLRTKPEYFNPGVISWVTSGETSKPYIFETVQCVSPLALKETNLSVYPEGTLIVAMYGQGKTRGQITELMIEAATNQACAAIRLIDPDECHRQYVKLFFEKIYDEIRELAAGGAQPNLNLSKVKETVIYLPPLPEQHRIVAKVDELMVLCDQLKSTITQASQLQKKLADVVVEQAIAS